MLPSRRGSDLVPTRTRMDSTDGQSRLRQGHHSSEDGKLLANKRLKTDVLEQDFDRFARDRASEESRSDSEWQVIRMRKNTPVRTPMDETLRMQGDSNSDADIPLGEDNMEVEIASLSQSDNRGSELFVNQAPPNKESDLRPSSHADHAARCTGSRDVGVIDGATVDARALAVDSVPESVEGERESFIVCGSTLRREDAINPAGTNVQRITRFQDDFRGIARISLRLPPDQTSNKKGRNLIKIWMTLSDLKICPTSVTMVNHFTAEADFKDFADANIALDRIVKLKDPVKLKANLDQRLIFCKGVISDWPSSIPDLWSAIGDRSKITKLERMYRRKWDPVNKKSILSVTDNILVTFNDNCIRDLNIFSYGVNLRVRAYVPQVRQCFNCFRFGHTKIACKSETRCIICGDKAHGQCDKTERCCNCGDQHRSTFRGCPAFEKTRNINVVMAHKNVSFHRARRIVEVGDSPPPPKYQSRILYPDAWPNLPEPPRTKSYSETARVKGRGSWEAHSPSPTPHFTSDSREPYPRAYNKSSDKRSVSYDASRNYYKQFDTRASDINKEKRGIMFSAARNGAAWSKVIREEESPQDDSAHSQGSSYINDTIEKILLLLQRIPEARDRLMDVLMNADSRYGPRRGPPQRDRVRLGFQEQELDTENDRHPRSTIARHDFRAVFDSVRGHQEDTVILGDLNAHNTLWNCASNNDSGDVLFDIMSDKDFLCVNTDTKSRVGYTGQRDSNLDLLFCSGGAVNRIDYQQMDETWDVLKNSVARASGRKCLNTEPILDDPDKRKRSHRWWDAECDEAIKSRKAAFSDFKRLKSLHSWAEYKRRCALAKKTINKKKKDNFEKFCSEINRFTSLSFVWNTIRIMKNSRKNIEWNKWQTTNRESEIRKSIDCLAPPSVGCEPIEAPDGCQGYGDLDAPFSRAELERAIDMVRRDSAPGLDGVEYKMLRLLPDSARICLLELFNTVWSTGVLPEDWHAYQVVFIDKVGREKVRPISLSSCVGKLMERLINERLIWWAEKEEKFSKSQSGFRRGRSCADNLARITSDIRSSISEDKYTLAAFLDVASAYDCVDYYIMLDKLKTLKCPVGIIRFISKWLYRRKVRFIVNSREFVDRLVYRGLPQGAVLSPALYSLFTQGLCADLPEGVEAVEFADDIGLYVSGINRERNRLLLERAVNIVAERLSRIGLDLEPRKTVLVEFSKSGYTDRKLSIRIRDVEVFNGNSAKFLGIWLDSRLSFHRQVQEVRGMLLSSLNWREPSTWAFALLWATATAHLTMSLLLRLK
ncbi:uncharacterized protein [Temnothorax nylanderi]|uniref:uncharacterized protein isoform X2 n=1 Tax=Temnothorax nylanderi TaxID=102681 RepID=UPI003A89F587